MKRLRSGMGITLAVVVTISVLIALTVPVTAIPDMAGRRSGEAHATSFEAMKNLMEQQMKLLPDGLEAVGGDYDPSQMAEDRRMSAYPDFSENFLTLLGTPTNPDTWESQSRGEHRVDTKNRELESRLSFEDLTGATDMAKQIEYRKALQSERMEMRDKSEELQPMVTFVHSSAGNEMTKFSSSFDSAPREESKMVMQGSGSLNLSGNYSTLWHQSLVANETSVEIMSDIDGDGLDDLLVSTVAHNLTPNTETITVIAKKGTNGTHLWEQSVSGTECEIWVSQSDDLDGDSLDDFILFEYTYNESAGIATITVIAKKGTNGTHLWEQSVSGTEFGIVLYWGLDLDGDGLSDFIFEDWIRDSVTYTETAEVIAKRGYDGTEFWKQTVSGEACNLYMDWIVDLDGDGLNDVIVNTWKYDFWTGAEAAKVTAKRGYDGALLWEQTTSGGACDIYADWIAELDGDGLDDVIVNTWEYDFWTGAEAAKVTAKRGYDGILLWEQSITALGYDNCEKRVRRLTDLDGDGLDDAIVYEWVYNEIADAETVKLIAKTGKNGTHLWEQSVNASGFWNCEMWLDWLADLDGDGLDDAIVYEWVYNETADAETVKLIAKTGKNGTHLWQQSVNASGFWNCDKWVDELVDLDGDGLKDAIVLDWGYNETTDTETMAILAKRGYDGLHLWEEQSVQGTWCEIEIDMDLILDLDGDGLDDVLVYEIEYTESTDTETIALIAKKGTNGTHLWEQNVSASGEGNCDIWIAELIDLDGDSLDDVIVYEWEYTNSAERETMAVIAKRGYDGAHLWEQSLSDTACDIWAGLIDDLDDDGLADVIVHEWTYNESTDTMSAAAIAKKGANGTHLWEQSLNDTECVILGYPAYDLNGDGWYDFIVYEFAYNNSTNSSTMSVIAKRGYDGTHLWEQSVNASGYWNCEIWVEEIADLDGDGWFEIIVYEGVYNVLTNTTTAAIITKEGSNGTHLWEQSVNASGEWNCDIWVDWLLDLDDDGLDDAVVIERVYNESTGTETVKIITKRGYDGTHLFEAQSNEPFWFAWWWDGYDLDGDEQNDLLLWIPMEMYAVTYNPNLFDTGESLKPYPSIMGVFNGRITPQDDTVVHTMYTYPCVGTGGHSEYVRIWGNGIDVNATWNGYAGDWQTLTFNEVTVTLEAGKTYNITIELGSYPQILHETSVNATGGTINCTTFEDVNGKTYYNWIPAIRIE